MDYLPDRSPDPAEHNDVFLLITGFVVPGFVATLFFALLTRPAEIRPAA